MDVPERASIGPFEDLVELAERHVSRQRDDMVVEMILLATIQISQLLVYVRTFPEKLYCAEAGNNMTLGLLRTIPRSCLTHRSQLASVLV